MKEKRARSALRTAVAVLPILPLYLSVVRPWLLRWGATPAEIGGPWPGDDLIPCPSFTSTRAVTICAPAASAWAWLVQIGHERGGTYSHTFPENLLGLNPLNVEWIVPRFQQISVGDEIQMATPFRFGGRGPGVVVAVEPERALILGHGSKQPGATNTRATWAFLLAPHPHDAGLIRFIIRARVAGHLSRPEKVAGLLVEPAHFLMERQMLLGIKKRAETSARRRCAPLAAGRQPAPL